MTEEFEPPSKKSERKRQSSELQDLGEALIGLSQAELDALPLPESLRDAVMLARRITAHGGLYRQKQYIGKLMRKIDANRSGTPWKQGRSVNALQPRDFDALNSGVTGSSGKACPHSNSYGRN